MSLKNIIRPSFVKAVILADENIRKANSNEADVVGSVFTGEIVTILQDKAYEWYQIKKGNGKRGWARGEILLIFPDEATEKTMLTKKQIEDYVKYKEFKSSTDYFVWVDISRQMVYILKKDKDNYWIVLRRLICSTGKNISPTKRGTFKIKDRGEWFYSETFKSGAMYWVRYSGSYLFHSIALNLNREVLEDTLGVRSSAGCIRMTIEDSKWFYDSIPKNTTVYIY